MKKILLSVFLALLMVSCVRDILNTAEKAQNVTGIQWNPSIAVPLVYSRLGIKDALDQFGDSIDFLRVESDGGLTVFFSTEYETKTASDILQLPNQVFADAIALSTSERQDLSNNGSVTLSRRFELEYDFGGNEMDRLLLKAGSGVLKVNSSLKHNYSVKVTFDDWKNDGSELIQTVTSNYKGFDPNEDSTNVDYANYEADFTKTAKGHTDFVANVEVTITEIPGNAVELIETIAFAMLLNEQRYKEVVGYFGEANFSNGIDTLEVDALANTNGGSFTAYDPKLKFVFSNSFGIPIAMDITQFDGTDNDGNVVSLTGLPSPLPFPNLSLAEFGQTKKDSLIIDRNTSNLADYLGNLPVKNVYEIDVNTNPGGKGAGRNWITDQSTIGVSVDAELPIHGTAKDFELEQIQEFEFPLDDPEMIEEVLLRIYTENGLPVDLALQAYFEDSTSNTVLDSLFGDDQLILSAADVDGDGKVTEAKPKTTDVSVTSEVAKNMASSNRVRIIIKFNTLFDGTTQPPVKFFEQYDVLLQLGVQTTANIDQDF